MKLLPLNGFLILELEIEDIIGNITVSESEYYIMGNITDFKALPGVILFLFIDSEFIAQESTPGCALQTVASIRLNYSFADYIPGEIIRIELKIAHSTLRGLTTLAAVDHIVHLSRYIMHL